MLVAPLAKGRGVMLGGWRWLPIAIILLCHWAGVAGAQSGATRASAKPPMQRAEEQFLAQRGWRAGMKPASSLHAPVAASVEGKQPHTEGSGGASWTAVGPQAISTVSYGLASGRVTALAIDPADPTGNHLLVGTTGGGLWQTTVSQASTTVAFAPLTDGIAALAGASDAGVSVGAVTLQPGATGVVLAGLGDPNDALDSYYGAGLLRSTDGGTTWSLISQTSDLETGLAGKDVSFVGEGFAGFAWSTTNVQLVVAAVSEAYESTVVNGLQSSPASYTGLYYSQDSGATWHMSRVTDPNGQDIQGAADTLSLPNGNPATAVVWNPVRQLFVAAIRYHGYYQSSDGVSWTRLTSQPGAGFTAVNCPSQSGNPGATGCPIFRGALAVNPQTGDTFAWSVDVNLQDQGIWRDVCGLSGGICSNPALSFGTQLNTAALESSSTGGNATILSGDYNLTLAAVPSNQDTLVFAGGVDVFRCSLANSCQWRNTTNATTCVSAGVGGYQHAIAWNPANPLLMFFGNDSGLWRSIDGVAETGSVCSSADSTHYANINAGLGPLAEVGTVAENATNPATLLTGVAGVGAAGVMNAPTPPGDWSQLLSGEGGAVVIDPTSTINNWYANNQAGVSIYHCDQATLCTGSGWGATPTVGDAQVNNDGVAMSYPATFVQDTLDPAQLVVGTCRVWRGNGDGTNWGTGNALGGPLDGLPDTGCVSNALIRSLAVHANTNGSETIYAGMAGTVNGGGSVPGHVFVGVLSASTGAVANWTDVALSPVASSSLGFNPYGYDISSITVDGHDTTGNTIYVTVEGFAAGPQGSPQVYRSTDGGGHWTAIASNLPTSPASAVVVDPQDSNTVYVGTDSGVYLTRQVTNCGTASCYAAYGAGLPLAPVTALTATPLGATNPLLTAATYGRGVWQIPLAATASSVATATVTPGSLSFAATGIGSTSASQSVTLTNTGSVGLVITTLSLTGADSGDFTETDTCAGQTLAQNAACTVAVTFAPSQLNTLTATLNIFANVSGGQLQASLTGVGVAATGVTLQPSALTFPQEQIGVASPAQSLSVENTGGTALTITSATASGPFRILSNSCGSSLAANTACAVSIVFTPTASGPGSGTFTVVDSAGTQTAPLTGTGVAAPTDTLSGTSVSFPGTVNGQTSSPITLQLTNSGGLPLTTIGTSVTGPFSVTTNCGSSLAAGSSCVLSVLFSPTSLGALSGTLTVSDALRSQAVQLSGTGLAPPIITLSPGNISFGGREMNVTTSPARYTITNTGGSPLVNATVTISGSGASSFQSYGPACPASIPVGQSCGPEIVFDPLSSGNLAATLTVSSTAAGVAPASIPITGTGLTPPSMLPSPATINFGQLKVTYSSDAYTIVVTNSGQLNLNPPTLALSGPNAADFSVSPIQCANNGNNQVPPGQTCTYQAYFNATVVGMEAATLTFTSSNSVPTQASVSLIGQGTTLVDLTSAPTSVVFPASYVGLVSVPETVVLSELTKQPLANFTLSLTGPFQLVPSLTTCGSTLLGAGSCNAVVTYTPTTVGTQAGTLTATSTTQGAPPLVVPLSGTGLAVGQLALNATELSYGSVVVNTTSATQQLTLNNNGAATINGLTVSVTGPFSITGNGCGSALIAADLCTVNVAYDPTATGNANGVLSVTSTSIGVPPISIPLLGNGIAPGAIIVSPSFVGFGSQLVGQSSSPQPVTVFNTGATSLTIDPITVTGDFSLTANTCGSQIAAGSNCTLYGLFSPTQPGERLGTITITATGTGIPVMVALNGTGLAAAQLTANVGALPLGSVGVGSSTIPQPVVVSNPGSAAITGLTFSASPPFVVQPGTCSLQLAAGSNCTAEVSFSPTVTGAQTGVLTITTTSLGVSPVTVQLSGTGLAGGSVVVSPNPVNFPATTVGATSAAQTATIRNPGASPVNGLTLAATGDFSISNASCPGTLIASGSCTVELVFKPSIIGGRQGYFNVSSTTSGIAEVSTLLIGTGLEAAQLSSNTASLSFPATLLKLTSATQTVTIANSGQSTINDLGFAASGPFQIVTSATTCGATLASAGSCVIGVAFAPSVVSPTEPVTGALTVSAPAEAAYGTEPVTVILSGTEEIPPSLAASPQSIVQFPVTSVSLASLQQTVTVSNQGTVGTLSGISATLPQASIVLGYSLGTNNCGTTASPVSLAAGASCTVQVRFTPASPGPVTGTLALASANGPLNLTLVGTGFDFTLSGQTTTASVVQGQTANFTLSLQSFGATSGVFTLTCPSAPAGMLCLFNPSQPTALPVGAQAQFALAISTAAPVSGTPGDKPANRSGDKSAGILTRGSVLLGAMILLPWMSRRRRLRSGVWLGALATLAALSLSSCAGAGGSTTQLKTGGGATAGTYTVEVTATSLGISHTTDITLVVN